MTSNNNNGSPRVTWVMVNPDFYVSYAVDSPDKEPLQWKCSCGRHGEVSDYDQPCGSVDCPGKAHARPEAA